MKKKPLGYIRFCAALLFLFWALYSCKPIEERHNPYLRVQFYASVLPLNDTGRLRFKAVASARSTLSSLNYRIVQNPNALVYAYGPTAQLLPSGTQPLSGAIDSFRLEWKRQIWYPGNYRMMFWATDIQNQVSDTLSYVFDYQSSTFPSVLLSPALMQNLILRSGDSLLWSGNGRSSVSLNKIWISANLSGQSNLPFFSDTIGLEPTNVLLQDFKFKTKLPDNLKTGQNISIFTSVKDRLGKVYQLERKIIIR